MILIIGAISIISLVLNIITLRILQEHKALSHDITVVFEQIPASPVDEPNDLPVEAEPTKTQVTVPIQEAYQGWKNQTNIPWVEAKAPLAPVKQPSNHGPLERPDGFV